MQFVPSPFPRSCATATVAAQGRVLSAEMASKMSGGQALQGATSKAGGPTSAPRQLHPRSAGKLAQCKAVQNLSTQAVNTLKQLNVEAPDVADIKIRDVKYVLATVSAASARALEHDMNYSCLFVAV
jgi:hypothetical protein